MARDQQGDQVYGALRMSSGEVERSGVLYGILLQLWRKRALSNLQVCEVGNGYEACRRYEKVVEKQQPGRSLSMLHQIINF